MQMSDGVVYLKEYQKYSRQMQVHGFGQKGQIALEKARILVVGAGGLGAAAIPYLVGAGIGHICVMDADIVELSNLHRQVIYKEADVGKFKAEIAVKYIKAQNSNVEAIFLIDKISALNAGKLAQQYDLILDCTDNYNAKYAMNDACTEADIPMVSASIEGMSGYLGIFGGDGFANYRALFNEPALNALNCADSGVLGTVAGMFGVMQAHEAIKYFSGVGDVMKKVLMLDMYDFSMHKIELSSEFSSNFKPFNLIELDDVGAKQLVDVREIHEFDHDHFNAAVNWPSSEISNLIDYRFDKAASLVLYCAKGGRAESAAIRLQRAGYSNLWLLSVGMG